jgi:hypothetical protein
MMFSVVVWKILTYRQSLTPFCSGFFTDRALKGPAAEQRMSEGMANRVKEGQIAFSNP